MKNIDETNPENMLKAENLLKAKKRAELVLTIIDVGMSELTDYQKELLNAFYIDKHKGIAEELCKRYYKERSSVYVDKTKALLEFSSAIQEIFTIA